MYEPIHIPVYCDPIKYDVYEEHHYTVFGVVTVLISLFNFEGTRQQARAIALKERLKYYKYCRKRFGKFRPLSKLR